MSKLVLQAPFLLFCAEYGHPLSDSLGGKAAGEPFQKFPHGISVGNPESFKSFIQKCPTCQLGRQNIDPAFFCVIRI